MKESNTESPTKENKSADREARSRKQPDRLPFHFRADTMNASATSARMAKSADAADLKSVGLKWLWEFKSPSGHHILKGF